MDYDVWFTRHEGEVYASLSKPGEAPRMKAREVTSVKSLLGTLRNNGHKVSQVGIVSPDMLGLEDAV